MSEHVFELLAVFIPVFGTFILFIKYLTNYWLKKKMIDQGLGSENVAEFFKNHNSDTGKYSSLKWGFISLFGGIGLIVINYLPYRSMDGPMPFGVFAVFVSLGFLLYYFYVKGQEDKEK